MTSRRLVLLLACVAWLVPSAAAAQAGLPAGVTRVTSVEGITEYRLANGLRLLVFPDPSKSTITVNVTYLVGSRHEGAGEGGMAHLLEHMVFKGSPKHPNIPQELTEHGARPNGSTSYDRTNYFETFQATAENLRWALDLESDRMVNSFVKKEDLDKEFSVVRNEFEASENNPIGVTVRHTLAAAYLAHSYGKPVIGNRSDVELVPIDNLQAFYRKYYQPDNAVLMVSGKVEEPQIVTMVGDSFGKIPRPSRTLAPTHTVEAAQNGERTTVVRRVGDVQAALAMYHVPDGAHQDIAAIEVLAGVLGEPSSGRLYKALVDTKKAAQVLGQVLDLNEPGVILIGAIVNKNDSLDEARRILLETVDGVVKMPPTKEDVDRTRSRLLKNVELGLRDSERIGLSISEWVAKGDWRLMFLERDRLNQVKPEDVQRVAAAYLKSSNRTIGEFIPESKPDRAEIPAKTDVVSLVKDYKGEAVMAAGEAFDPAPANIDVRTERYRLPSGMKVSLLSKRTRGASVQATIRIHFGDVDGLKGKQAAASLAGATLMRGTAKRDRQQIQDEITRLKAQLQVGGGATAATATISTTRENLAASLRLAGEILKEASLPEAEFEQARKAQLTGLENVKSEPQVLAMTQLARRLYPFARGDVRGTPSIDEQIEDVKSATLQDARTFYKNFYGASTAELAVVGDFDVAEVKRVADELFGGWKSPAKYERPKTGFQAAAPANEGIETPDKANAMFAAGLRVNVGDRDPDYAALVFGNYMLGGGFLNSRLAARIRQNEGLSYGISSNFGAKSTESDGQFQVAAIAAPQNVAKVEAAVKEEIEKVLKDGFTQQEVNAARAGWTQSQQVNRSEDRALTQILGTRDYDGRTMSWDDELQNRVMSLTPDDIRAAMRKHLDVSKLVIVKAGDFKKAASQ